MRAWMIRPGGTVKEVWKAEVLICGGTNDVFNELEQDHRARERPSRDGLRIVTAEDARFTNRLQSGQLPVLFHGSRSRCRRWRGRLMLNHDKWSPWLTAQPPVSCATCLFEKTASPR